MATRLERFEFGRGYQSKYPWHQWLDGSIWKVVQGEDFTCKTPSMWTTLTNKAKKTGMKLQARIVDDNHAVVFQFTKQSAPSLGNGNGNGNGVPRKVLTVGA